MNFPEYIMGHEAIIRLTFFLAIFGIMAPWGLAAPRRALTVSKGLRWSNNLGLVVVKHGGAAVVRGDAGYAPGAPLG